MTAGQARLPEAERGGAAETGRGGSRGWDGGGGGEVGLLGSWLAQNPVWDTFRTRTHGMQCRDWGEGGEEHTFPYLTRIRALGLGFKADSP